MGVYLITGGAGFIGSNFISLLLEKEKDAAVINLDKLTYAGDISRTAFVQGSRLYKFIHGDICDKHAVNKVFEEYKPDYVVNFAAETHVDRSISGSEAFMRTNVLGTHVLLQSSLEHGVKRFLQVSTDEVYGATDIDADLKETAVLTPGNPYAASKAAGDMIALAYHNTFQFPALITRSSNNFGYRQHNEKLIPMVIEKCLHGEEIPIYGNGLQIRDWIYVEDNCSAIYSALKRGMEGQIYNISGDNKIDNISLVRQIIGIARDMLPVGDHRKSIINDCLISFVEDRKGHDSCYSISAEKIKAQLGWSAKYNFKEALEHTVKLYMEYIG